MLFKVLTFSSELTRSIILTASLGCFYLYWDYVSSHGKLWQHARDVDLHDGVDAKQPILRGVAVIAT